MFKCKSATSKEPYHTVGFISVLIFPSKKRKASSLKGRTTRNHIIAGFIYLATTSSTLGKQQLAIGKVTEG